MPDLDLGTQVERLTVRLARDSTFVTELVNTEGDWGIDDAITLRFPSATWTATKSGPTATFTADAVAVNGVLDTDGKEAHVELWYSDGTNEIKWASGSVRA